jgi:hypothetical protein
MLIPKSIGARVVKLALLPMVATATVAAEPVSITSFDIPSGQFVGIVFPGALSTQVDGINDCGVVIGVWGDGSTAHGFYGRPGNLHSFDLTGAAATFTQGINNEGHIVERHATADGDPHAFVSSTFAAASRL